jgi:hypothetical protein
VPCPTGYRSRKRLTSRELHTPRSCRSSGSPCPVSAPCNAGGRVAC